MLALTVRLRHEEFETEKDEKDEKNRNWRAVPPKGNLVDVLATVEVALPAVFVHSAIT